MKAYAINRTATGNEERIIITIIPELEKDGYVSYSDYINITCDTKNEDTAWSHNINVNLNQYDINLKLCKAIVQILEKSERTTLNYINPSELIETLDELKYKRVFHHDGMNKYYTEKDFPSGDTYKLIINDQFEAPFTGQTEYEATKKARKYVLKQLESYTSKKYLDWLESPKMELYKYSQTYFVASTLPGNTMSLVTEDIPA